MSAVRGTTRVLVVDDEGSLLMTLAANLELEGFEVVEANSGDHALRLLATERVDLVLSDIRMPGMSGVDLFHRIRDRRPELPVVLMTAFAAEPLIEQAISKGAFAVLAKPFAIEHVVATLQAAARRPVVLVVDGAPDDADRTARDLATLGVAARAAHDEQTALGLVQDGTVDVCVIDLHPGGEISPALAKRIILSGPGIALVAVSPHAAPSFTAQIVSLGAFAWLEKPCDLAELVRVIARARGLPPSVRPPRLERDAP